MCNDFNWSVYFDCLSKLPSEWGGGGGGTKATMPPSANHQRFLSFKNIPLVQFLKTRLTPATWACICLGAANAGQGPVRTTSPPHGMSAKDAPMLSPAGAVCIWQREPKVNSLSKLSLATGSSEINMLIHKLSTVIITVRSCNYKRH